MASIIGGIGTSHVPTIAMAYDRGKRNDPVWAPLFKGYEPVARWMAERRPDVLVLFYNDHATTFFFDHYPTFALGVSAEYPIADEGLGPRPVPPLKGHPALARHMAESLVNDEFDISVAASSPRTRNFVAPIPARVTRSVQIMSGSMARLPSARRTSSSGTPTSIKAPRIMSPDAPAKQ